MATRIRRAWVELSRRPPRERALWLALFASIIVPPVVGIPLFVVGWIDHIEWMKIAGLAIVLTSTVRNQVVFPLLRRRHAQSRPPSESSHGTGG